MFFMGQHVAALELTSFRDEFSASGTQLDTAYKHKHSHYTVRQKTNKQHQKQKHRPTKDNAYRQDIVTRIIMLLYESGVNYNVNSKYTKYFAQLCGRILTFWKTSIANLRILWRHLLIKLGNVQCVVEHIQSSNSPQKQRLNQCLIGDAILPKLVKSWPENAVHNLAVCSGAI